MRCRGDTEGYRYHKLKDGRDKRYGEGNAHMVDDNVKNGLTVDEARAEVESAERAEPLDISLDDAEETVIRKTVHFVHLFDRRCIKCLSVQRRDLVRYVVVWHTANENVYDQRNAKQDKQGKRKSFDDILKHFSLSRFIS